MREVTDHWLDDRSDNVEVRAEDLGPGGADHKYTLKAGDTEQVLLFQRGPVREAGLNGVTEEALIAVLIDRFTSFRDGPFSHPAHSAILEHLEGALEEMHGRTRERESRGVKGTSVH
jgi:hypothetical protein